MSEWIDQNLGSDIQKAQGKQTSYKPNYLNDILSMGGNIVGGMTGQRVGLELGALVPGADLSGVPEVAGAYAGRVGLGGVGAAAGNAGADLIRKLTGDKTVNLQTTLNNTPDQFRQGAESEAIGVPIAKGLGVLAHPIAPFIGRVNKILEKSPQEVNVGEVGGLLDQFKKEVMPRFNRQGLGVEAQDAYNGLATRVVNMVDAMKPHVPAENIPGSMAQTPTNADKLVLPIADANEMKRNLYKLAQDSYGFIAKPDQEAIKQFARLTRNQIHLQEPGTKLPDTIASTLYKGPDFAKNLTTILGLGNPAMAHAIQTVSSIPGEAIQKVIPKGGGYLNQLIPALFQGGMQLNKSANQ